MMIISQLPSFMAAHTAQNSSMKVPQQNNFQSGIRAPLCLAVPTKACNSTFLIFI